MNQTLDDWLQSGSETSTEPAPTAPSNPIDPHPWRTWAIVALLGIAIFQFALCSPNDSTDDREDDAAIELDGTYALLLIDKSESGQSKLSAGQAASINSTQVSRAAKDADVQFRVVGIDEDISQSEPAWQVLRREASAPPSLTVVRDGRIRTGKAPESIEATINAIRGDTK